MFEYERRVIQEGSKDSCTGNILSIKLSFKTLLFAKFRFGQEVEKSQRAEVAKRCNPNSLDGSGVHFLDLYLQRAENANRTTDYSDKRALYLKADSPFRTIKISPTFRLGFNLQVEAPYNELPLEQLINLDNLNQAILKGVILAP